MNEGPNSLGTKYIETTVNKLFGSTKKKLLDPNEGILLAIIFFWYLI